MSGRARGITVAIASVVLVLTLVMAATERQSPGPVSTVHGRIAELDGGAACAACHGGWFGDMQEACSECHEEIATQLDDGQGLHGSLDEALAKQCATCHGEHHGGDFELVNRLAFAQAGVEDPAQFDHRRIGWDMAGAHVGLACTECHEHAETNPLPEGAQRYLGLSRDCASCHIDPHGGRMEARCDTCHSQQTFTERFVAGHDRRLPLVGAHEGLACRTCHQAGTENALEGLVNRVGPQGRACADCHDAPHAEAFVAGNAANVEMDPKRGCVACHLLEHRSFDDPGLGLSPLQHAHSGFALAAPHDGAACTDCHKPEGTFAERHPGRRPDDCRACHTDPHAGQFDDSPLADQDCVSCHARTHFAPHGFDAAMHARTRMPLDGAHGRQECGACHDEILAAVTAIDAAPPRRFRGTPHRCEQCHDDAHVGAFAHRGEELAAAPRGTCAVCHGTEAFAQLEHARFDHADWTGFTVSGAHAQIACTDCHARAEQPDRFGRRFGRIPAHDGMAPGECVRCHGDPHEGLFDRDGAPAEVDGRTGCERCHDTASFRALPHGFEHERFTGFALKGKHGALDCSECHEPLPHATGTGRTWGKARGTTCADCHQDPHRGQFDRFGKTDCTRCHKSANTFATLSFRHNLDSRFRLGEQHRNVACALCHKPETVEGKTFVRYKPLPTKCVDCHGREEGGAPGRRRRR